MPATSRTPRRRLPYAAVATALVVGLSGCSAIADDAPDGDPAAEEKAPAARVALNVPTKKPVSVDTLVKVKSPNGALKKVRVQAGKQKLPGSMTKNQSRWVAQERLEPGTTYRVVARAANESGKTRTVVRTFTTEDLTLDQQTYASIAPIDGETVGVGMPVVVQFDIPVTDRANIEKHLSVETKPGHRGSWYWISDSEVHWRPKDYWKPGTKVTVEADINGVSAGNGIYGQHDRRTSFTVGDALVMKIDADNHTMRVLRNGSLLRTLPITTGKPGFETRSGTKVIMEKHRYKDMDAATTGISESDEEYYNIENVEYAMRVTYSGEFLHAAPWSVGSQGSANVSHGCVGMSPSDAGWLYSQTKRGDVVEVTGTDRPMELSNGFGDWNLSWSEYRKGSAL